MLCGSLTAISLTGCARRNGLHTLRVSANPHFTMSGLYLAQELGYFSDLGLRVELRQIAKSSQAIALAAGGELDVVFTSASAAMVNAIARGARLRIVAGREMTVPDCSDISTLYGIREVFPDGLQDIRLLKGKRVAANFDASLAGFSVDALLATAGYTAQDLSILKMAPSESVAALLAGHIDAAFITDFAKRYLQVADRIVRGIALSDVMPNHQVSFILFGSTLLDGDPDMGTRFLSAYLRGAREYLGGRFPKYHDELARTNGIDPAIARKACRNTFASDGRIDFPSLDRFIHWAITKGYCAVPARAEQLVDTRFLEAQRRT